MVEVKICGLTTAEAVDAALQGGARWLGFVFFEKSPRHLTIDRAAGLAAPVRGRADIVAVTVNADDALLRAIQSTLKPDWIQLHGREPPRRSGEARAFAGKGVIRALPIAQAEDFAAADGHAPAADWLLFDAKAPQGAALPGGNGAAFDWRLLAGRRFDRPYLLSGGLSVENVASAVAQSGALAVDVSSGVEASPGVKDPQRVTEFLRVARAADPMAGASYGFGRA